MTKQLLREIFDRHCLRLESQIQKRKELSSKVSTLRIAFFIGSVLLLFLLRNSLPDGGMLILVLILISCFILIARQHQKIDASKRRFEEMLVVKQEHLSRMDLNWERIPKKNLSIEQKDHPFAHDLDLLGERSISHLIDTTIYDESALLLRDWLLVQNPEKTNILLQQEKVRELMPLQTFRDKLRVIGAITKSEAKNEWTNSEMLKWLRRPAKVGLKKALFILSGLAFLNFLFLGLMLTKVLSPLFLMVSLVAYLVNYKLTEKLYSDLFDATFNIEKILNRFKEILKYLEKYKAADKKHLAKLLASLRDAEEPPSKVIKKAQWLMTRAALQANEILWIIVNVCIPWDMYHALKLQELRISLEPKLTQWLDSFYELEAFNALANFAMLNPEYTWPTFELPSNTLFESNVLGHPLIPDQQRVCNTLKIESGSDLFLITGSNMAGKSTFLRTVGVNLILANAGAPVCAKKLNTQPYRVFTSINIVDSLDDGYSHFYAEVRRLKQLLDELIKDEAIPLFFLVDEIYRGTNNRERFTGSAAFLKEIAGKNGVGMVSSHDLELAELEKEIPHLTNLHFVESITDNKMSFEYLLREGPCPSTNALLIMKMEGLPT